MPAPPPDSSDAREARREQCDGRRFGHCGHKFGDHHLAFAGLEIGDQDLVRARVEGAAATALTFQRPPAPTAPSSP